MKQDMSAWLQAESEMKIATCQPKPPGAITPDEYAVVRGIGHSAAQKILKDMCECDPPKATRQKWNNGLSGTRYLYVLIPKKEAHRSADGSGRGRRNNNHR